MVSSKFVVIYYIYICLRYNFLYNNNLYFVIFLDAEGNSFLLACGSDDTLITIHDLSDPEKLASTGNSFLTVCC
jgi:hypothetical protein